MLLEADQESRARLMATSQKESGAWLNALPVSSLGTLLVAIALRMGADVCIPHSCRCVGRMNSEESEVWMACPANTVLAAFQGIRQ